MIPKTALFIVFLLVFGRSWPTGKELLLPRTSSTPSMDLTWWWLPWLARKLDWALQVCFWSTLLDFQNLYPTTDLSGQLSGVHDSFWTHACDVDEMNEILRQKFVELYETPILENVRRQGWIVTSRLWIESNAANLFVWLTISCYRASSVRFRCWRFLPCQSAEISISETCWIPLISSTEFTIVWLYDALWEKAFRVISRC